MKGLGAYASMAAFRRSIAMPMPTAFSHRDMLLNHARDPNAFYFKHGRRGEPLGELVLECAQWRHGANAESFEAEIDHPVEADTLSGALECEVEAENLSTPLKLLIPVRMTIKRVSAIDLVNDRIDYLVRINRQNK